MRPAKQTKRSAVRRMAGRIPPAGALPAQPEWRRVSRMPIAADLARSIDDAVDRSAKDLAELAKKIHAHPELRFEETKAAAWICEDRKSTRLNSSHLGISYAVF